MAEMFGITNVAVRQHYGNLVRRGLAPKINKTRTWTIEELEYLKGHYNDPIQELCSQLGRSDTGIRMKIRDIGLKRDTRGNV